MSGGLQEGLQKNWVPLTIGALGAGLAGAGRAGSPASNLGIGLVQPLLTYYMKEAVTADERARRQRIEDELLQRQREQDDQTAAWRMVQAFTQGGWQPTTEPKPGTLPATLGKTPLFLQPPAQTSMEPFARMAESAYGPEAAAEFRQAMTGVDPRQVPILAKPFFEALQVRQGRQQAEGLGNVLEQLSRPQVKEDTGQEWAVSGPPALTPPPISPAQAAFYKAGMAMPDVRQQAVKSIDQVLASQPDLMQSIRPIVDALKQGPTGAASRVSWGVTQRPGERGPTVSAQVAPESATERETTRNIEDTKASAMALERDPQFLSAMQRLPMQAQVSIKNLLADAKRGNSASLSSVHQVLLSSAEPQKLGLQDLELAWYRQHPEDFQKYMRARSKGNDKETFYLKQIASMSERKQYLPPHELNPDGSVKTLNPQLAKIEQEESLYWRRLAEQDPQQYFEEAFTHLPRLLRWTRDQFNREAQEFAIRHNLKITGGQ